MGRHVIYGLLGELQVGRDGRMVELPTGHTLTVLAALLINANRRVSKGHLLQAAWGDAEVGEAQLHKAAAAIRAFLHQIGCRDRLVTHARYGYELRASDEELDMLQFQRLLRQAGDAANDRRTEDEIDNLRGALRLWRGQHPLSNVPSDAFRRQITGLDQRRKRAAVRLFDLEIARHHYDQILDDLLLLAGYYPTDRRLCEQLMIVLYRSGHETDATRAFELYEVTLDTETGGTPDPQLRALYYAIGRREEPAIEAAESAIARRARAAGRPAVAVAMGKVPRQLPADPADFVGRGDLVAEASWLLGRQPRAAVPVIVVCGPGGIGKTALAQRVSHVSSELYPDGQLYVELRGAAGESADTSEVLAQFLRALGIPAVPETRPERITLYRTELADRRVLVVLDDVANGAQVRDLTPANPQCAVLVTARRRLPEISGAHHLPPLEPLDPDAATELFLGVVRRSGIDLKTELDAVQRVVALCGGLPLALRIAGALRVHSHPRPTAELADRLAQQGPEGFAYGEESVARTIGTGFDRLDPDARRLLLGLGLLPLPAFGSWTAAALLHDEGVDAAAALSQLGASNMVDLVEADLRYRFHRLTRDYVYRRARVEYPVDTRHAMVGAAYRALLTLTRRAHAALYGGDYEVVHSAVPDWDAPAEVLAEIGRAPLDWFERERQNIRAAVNHCASLGLADVCWDLAVSAHEFYTVRGYFDDWYATHTVALRAAQEARDIRGEGMVLASLGQPALVASRRAGGVSGPAELERAVELLASCGDRHGQAIALRTLGNALRRRGQLARALQLFTAAAAHYAASQDHVGRWQALRFIGQTHLDRGSHDLALQTLRDAEGVAGELGVQRLTAQTRYWIGQTYLAVGDIASAEAAFRAVLEVYAEPRGVGHAYAQHGLGDVARRSAAFGDAERHLGVAARLARDGADAILEGRVSLSVGALHAALGRRDQQIAALDHAVRCFSECGAIYLEAQALFALGSAHADRADTAAAQAAWGRMDELYAAMALPEEDRVDRRPPTSA